MTLAKFKRKDDNKIKELTLNLEKLTVQKNKFEYALEKEITEKKNEEFQKSISRIILIRIQFFFVKLQIY